MVLGMSRLVVFLPDGVAEMVIVGASMMDEASLAVLEILSRLPSGSLRVCFFALDSETSLMGDSSP
jgi:hypothetical protein